MAPVENPKPIMSVMAKLLFAVLFKAAVLPKMSLSNGLKISFGMIASDSL